MRKYVKPNVVLLEFDKQDVLTASVVSDVSFEDYDFGGAWL